MASHTHLRRLAAIERNSALAVLDELLPENSPAREALIAAQRDVVGSKDPEFQLHALVGVMARVLEAQEQRIAELEAKLEAKPATKRPKSHVAAPK